MKEYKVTTFSVDGVLGAVGIEINLNKYAKDGFRLVAAPTEESGYGLLIFERDV